MQLNLKPTVIELSPSSSRFWCERFLCEERHCGSFCIEIQGKVKILPNTSLNCLAWKSKYNMSQMLLRLSLSNVEFSYNEVYLQQIENVLRRFWQIGFAVLACLIQTILKGLQQDQHKNLMWDKVGSLRITLMKTLILIRSSFILSIHTYASTCWSGSHPWCMIWVTMGWKQCLSWSGLYFLGR